MPFLYVSLSYTYSSDFLRKSSPQAFSLRATNSRHTLYALHPLREPIPIYTFSISAHNLSTNDARTNPDSLQNLKKAGALNCA